MLLGGGRRNSEGFGYVTIVIAAQDELYHLYLALRQAVTVLEHRHVAANLPDADSDIATTAGKRHQMDYERFVVVARERNGRCRLLRPLTRLCEMIDQHHDELDLIRRSKSMDETRPAGIGVDQALSAKDEDCQRQLVKDGL